MLGCMAEVGQQAEVSPLCPLSETERLADARLVTFVLRLTLDEHGQVVSGELADTESAATRRFQGKQGLIRTLLASLEMRQGVKRTECPTPKSSTV
jgi:hypothetical protein